MLETLAVVQPDGTALGSALAEIGALAQAMPEEAVAAEYNELFIGLTRGELVPYASYYLTGFLYEKPLARLRGDMSRLGIARADASTEPEDHIAALCEMMAGLIVGAFGAPADLTAAARLLRRASGPVGRTAFRGSGSGRRGALLQAGRHAGPAVHGIESEAFAMAA